MMEKVWYYEKRNLRIGIWGGKECMKKKLRILVILIAVLLVGTVGYYFMPKKFGKNVNPSVRRCLI